MPAEQILGVLSGISTVIAGVWAILAWFAYYRARSALQNLRHELLDQGLMLERLMVQMRRMEGRQTATLGRNNERSNPSGLPDPDRDPEAWRAAVRRLAIKPKSTNGDLQ